VPAPVVPTPRVAAPATPQAATAEAVERSEGSARDEVGGTAAAQRTSDSSEDGVLRILEVGLLLAILGFGALALGQWVAHRARRA